jgi:hypothetical protein
MLRENWKHQRKMKNINETDPHFSPDRLRIRIVILVQYILHGMDLLQSVACLFRSTLILILMLQLEKSVNKKVMEISQKNSSLIYHFIVVQNKME